MSKKDPTPPDLSFALRGDNGVLISAPNGDVIQFDDSGLIMKLSDQVVRDLAARLADVEDGSTTAAPLQTTTGSVSLIDAEVLGDVDAWHVLQDGDWFRFQANLRGADGPRGYRKPVHGGDIFADAPGAVLGLLSIGGPRRATGIEGHGRFPYHVVAPNDDVGAVGLIGSGSAQPVTGFSTIGEQTRDTLIAHAILQHQKSAGRALPLIMARCEADQSHDATALSRGAAFDNLLASAETLATVARSMGKTARILAVGLDYCIEDTTSTEDVFRDGIYALMQKTEQALGRLGFRKPCFISQFECGGLLSDDECHTEAQWQLAVNPGTSDLIYSAPGYMFEQNAIGRPTPAALGQMAEMDAHAIRAWSSGERIEGEFDSIFGPLWCPTFLLAEREGGPEGTTIRISATARSALVIDGQPDFGNVTHAGFSFENVENGAKIVNVRTSPDAPLDIFLDCDKPPEGTNLRLRYASGQRSELAFDPDRVGFPVNRGSVRDGWSAPCSDGRQLYRWALPCVLPVN
ncbi:hypothetical protein [Shimia sediminis]|uniref:hypothetical protein n=1 Tax=Shimia sediminis TaxID=2497945 RepID=UPI000F8F68DD|nr:hypothetical protein [Shimia sediminis]